MSKERQRISRSGSLDRSGLNRRPLVLFGSVAALTAAYLVLNTEECVNRDAITERKIREEVKRLAGTLPDDDPVRAVYLNQDFLRQNFTALQSVSIGFAREGSFTEFAFSQELTREEYLTIYIPGGETKKHGLLKSFKAEINFSKEWLDAKNDRIKLLAMRKEAIQLLVWPSVVESARFASERQGWVIRELKPIVSEEEKWETITSILFLRDRNLVKLWDYAGYLGILAEADDILEHGMPEERRALIENIDFFDLIEQAKAKGVPREAWSYGTEQHLFQSFDDNSIWAKIILDPRYPMPPMEVKGRDLAIG